MSQLPSASGVERVAEEEPVLLDIWPADRLLLVLWLALRVVEERLRGAPRLELEPDSLYGKCMVPKVF